MILGLAITKDDRFAAAFTTNNQLIIIDIMLGHYLRIEKVISLVFYTQFYILMHFKVPFNVKPRG